MWKNKRGRKYFTSFPQMKVRAQLQLKLRQTIQLSTVDLLLLLLLLVGLLLLRFRRRTGCDFEAFPAKPCLVSIRRPTCSARGAIRGLTLRRQRLLLTDRLLPTGRSTHLKCFPRISSCHPPLGRTRESLLGLQKTCWPRKKCTRETSTDVLPIPIHRHAFLSGTAHKLMKSTSSVDTPCCFSPRGSHATSIHSIFRTFPFLSFSQNN